MENRFPQYINLFFFKDPDSVKKSEPVLCHKVFDDYGNFVKAIPLKINSEGHLTLDFPNVIDVKID